MFVNFERDDNYTDNWLLSIWLLSRDPSDLRQWRGNLALDEWLLIFLDAVDIQSCNQTKAESTNTGFINRWNRIKQSKEVQLLGRLHSDICNVIPYLLPGVKLQIKLTKGKRAFYLKNTKADSTTKFQFLEACLIVNRIRPNPAYLIAHNTTLSKGDLARYVTRVELKTFLFRRTEILVHWQRRPRTAAVTSTIHND